MIKLDNIANRERVWYIPERKRGVRCYQNNAIQRWYGFWCKCARWCVHKILLQRVTNGKIADPSRTWSPYAYGDSPYAYGEGGQKFHIWGVPVRITKLCAYWGQHIRVSFKKKLGSRLITFQIVVRCQRLIAGKVAVVFLLNRGISHFCTACCINELSKGFISGRKSYSVCK